MICSVKKSLQNLIRRMESNNIELLVFYQNLQSGCNCFANSSKIYF